jgi:ribosomal protein L37AE/L43A
MARTKPVCSHCGSDDVKADAYAVWDIEAQTWQVGDTYDKGAFCEACEGETRLDWQDVPETA